MIHRNSDNLSLYLFDRSRLECAAECPRKYYWLYACLGIGIVKIRDIPPYWPYITGSFIHEGIELVIKGVNGKDAATKVSEDYRTQYAPIINQPDIQPELMARLQMELEQEIDLVRALVYGWSVVGYPRLLASYDPVEGGIEQEETISWIIREAIPNHGAYHSNSDAFGNDIIESEMSLMTRTDLLARAKASPTAILFNFKSTKEPNDKWRNTFTRDMQTLTEAMAVEARLGIKVDGVIIEGLVKGKYSEYPKGSGFYQSSSMLIYAWTKDTTDVTLPGEEGGTIYATSWDWTCTGPHTFGNNQRCPGGKNHTLGKGFRKRPVRDCFPGGVLGWIDYLVRNDPACLESYFIQLPPITRDDFQVERWKRQKLHAEKDRQDHAAIVDARFMEGNKEAAYLLLDHYFPMNEGYQCLSCSYNDICWSAADPFDETVWRARVPNHEIEAEKLVNIAEVQG